MSACFAKGLSEEPSDDNQHLFCRFFLLKVPPPCLVVICCIIMSKTPYPSLLGACTLQRYHSICRISKKLHPPLEQQGMDTDDASRWARVRVFGVVPCRVARMLQCCTPVADNSSRSPTPWAYKLVAAPRSNAWLSKKLHLTPLVVMQETAWR